MTAQDVATALLASFDSGQAVADHTVPADLDLPGAQAIQAMIIAARRSRGERTVGYKIGFTNRTIWDRYGVHHPIWSPMFDSTVRLLDSDHTRLSIGRFHEPRLEPEIVVRLAREPDEATPLAVARSLEWVAHGFEIVQSAYPGWRFTGAQAFAAQGLHGALLVGPRHPVPTLPDPARLADWLSALQIALHLNHASAPVDTGRGHVVLDGPLHAIAHLVAAMAADGEHLQAGDIITTGTLTDAQPLAPGQHWHTVIEGISPIAGLNLTVEDR